MKRLTQNDPAELGLNLFVGIMDEANFNPRAGVLPVGTPIRHRSLPEVVGVIRSSFMDDYKWWYVIDWLVEGFAPQARQDWIRELPSAMHLLASV